MVRVWELELQPDNSGNVSRPAFACGQLSKNSWKKFKKRNCIRSMKQIKYILLILVLTAPTWPHGPRHATGLSARAAGRAAQQCRDGDYQNNPDIPR